jgi:hypothetical protein
MRTLIVKWTIGSVLLVAVLAGAYRIIQMDRAAMTGSTNGEVPSFYGH